MCLVLFASRYSKNGPLPGTLKSIIKIMDFFLLNWRSIDYIMIWIIVAYKLCRSYLASRKQYVSVNGREQFDLCLVSHKEYKPNNTNALTLLYTSVENIRWSKKISCSKWIDAVLNSLEPSLACLEFKNINFRTLSKFERSFSEKKNGKTPSSHIIHSLEGERCWIVRDSEPIRSLKTPTSLSVYILTPFILISQI